MIRMPPAVSAVLLAGTAASAASAPTPATLQRRIVAEGPQRVAASMTGAAWDRTLAQAAAGRPDWLQLAAALRPGTDGARSESIDQALSDALPTNPAVVLTLMDHGGVPGAAWLCQDRYIEPDPQESRRRTAAMIAAVSSVRDQALDLQRDRCLAALHRAPAAPAH